MSKLKYSDDALIELVRKKACIYDPTARNHTDRNQVRNAWIAIANKFEEDDVTDVFCQTAFGRLRDNRGARLRRLKKKFRSGSQGSWPPENLENDNMSFLDTVKKRCQTNHLGSIRLAGQRREGADGEDAGAPAPPIENCSAAIQAANERREAAAGQREPPSGGFIPGQSPRIPRGGLYPAVVVQEAGGAGRSNPPVTSSPNTPERRAPLNEHIPGTPLSARRSLAGSGRRRLRDRGNIHGPVRFSPSDHNSIRRADSDSASSIGSTASATQRSRSRRRGRPSPSTRASGERPPMDVGELSTIHEADTAIGSDLGAAESERRQADTAIGSDLGAAESERRATQSNVFSPGSQGSRAGVRVVQSPAVSLTLSAQRREARAATMARRQQRLQEKDRSRRAQVQAREARLEGLRANIALQAEARRAQLENEEQARRHRAPQLEGGPVGAPALDMAIFRQILDDKEVDIHGQCGQTIAALLRPLPPAVSSRAWLEFHWFAHRLTTLTEQEITTFLEAEPGTLRIY